VRKQLCSRYIINIVKITTYLSLLITLQACGKEGGGVSVSESTGSGGSSGAASLTWTEPTTNVDGTSLINLAGYKVYYGTTPVNYTTSLDIGNVTTYTVTGLSSGTTYYFAVIAYNTNGGESGFSNEVSKAIQ